MTFNLKRVRPARGSFGSNGQGGTRKKKPAVSVTFDQRLFDRIANEAATRGMPFGAVVRERLMQAYSASRDPKAPLCGDAHDS